MKIFKLNRDLEVFVDDEDAHLFNKYHYYVSGNYVKRNYYITPIKRGTKYLHRDIMNPENKIEVDHINGNTLDNQKKNLRFVNRKQNQ